MTTPIEQAIDKIEGELKTFRQNSRPEDYLKLLLALDDRLLVWLEAEDKGAEYESDPR